MFWGPPVEKWFLFLKFQGYATRPVGMDIPKGDPSEPRQPEVPTAEFVEA